MKIAAWTTVGLIAALGLSACGRPKMERCKFVEIEDAEFEVEFGDIDAEGGEVEMICADDIVDVSWRQFRRRLRIDPGDYKGNLEGFKQEVTCLRKERSRKREIFCSRPSFDDEFVTITFTYDD